MTIRAAGIVPLRRDDNGWKVLILRVYRNWDFPKGVVDPGEDRVQTAIREAEEEADLRDLEFPWGHRGFDTAPYSRGKVATYYPATTARTDVVLPVSTELGRPEHHEGRWVDLSDAARLLPARLQPVLQGVVELVS